MPFQPDRRILLPQHVENFLLLSDGRHGLINDLQFFERLRRSA